MVLALLAAPLGAALGALAGLLLEAPVIVQVRRGWVRTARSWLGASIGRAGWRRRLVSQRVGPPARVPMAQLSDAEDAWLLDVAQGGVGEEVAQPAGPPRLGLELSLEGVTDTASPLMQVALRVTNRGRRPISPAELDDAAGGICWRARANDEDVPIYFSREERERRLMPGGSLVLRPRFDLGRLPRAPVALSVSCRGGASNQVTYEPAGGAL
jgi:hypothetical protein